jgi:hypothetical protein
MRRAKLEGRRIGRRPLDVDREAVLRDRDSGMTLTQVAEAHGINRAMVSKIVKQLQQPKPPVPENANEEIHARVGA